MLLTGPGKAIAWAGTRSQRVRYTRTFGTIAALVALALALALAGCGDDAAGSVPGGAAPDGGGPVGGGALPDAGPQGPAVAIAVDTGQTRHAISPYVYGYNAGSTADAPPGTTWLRLGGNRWTAYNWETNYSNAGSDYGPYHNDTLMGSPSDGPGHAALPTLADARSNGLAVCVTVPIQGWVSKDASGNVPTTGPLTDHFLQSLARKGAPFTLTPDTSDASVYQDELANLLATHWSGAPQPLHLMLDNEPDLWSSTHAEIQRTALSYAALLTASTAFAGALKDAVPGALVFGPASYGWAGFSSLQNAPDASQHGDFLEYYLSQMSAASASAGHRLLDVLDVHWYSEAQGCGTRVIAASNDDCLVAARVQAPRSLWDATFVEPSWITRDTLNNQAIRLVPRLLAKIASNYPGTKLSISEYNHGGGDHISGAVAQADTLGIFGREGVFAASFWALGTSTWAAGAWLGYRNYDGAGRSFGDTSVSAASADIAHLSAFASVDTTGPERVVIVLVHRPTLGSSGALDLAPRTAAVKVTNPHALTHARIWQLTSSSPVTGNAARPQRLADVAVSGNAFSVALPALSVTTIELTP
jgi:glycosyl hydrolase family 44